MATQGVEIFPAGKADSVLTCGKQLSLHLKNDLASPFLGLPSLPLSPALPALASADRPPALEFLEAPRNHLSQNLHLVSRQGVSSLFLGAC